MKKTRNSINGKRFSGDEKFTRLSKRAELHLGMAGRMTYRSKAAATHTSIFNANLFNDKAEKIWFGDLELGWQRDREALVRAAGEEGTLYILREEDGRFLEKAPTPSYVPSKAVAVVENGDIFCRWEYVQVIEKLKELYAKRRG